MFDGCVLGIDPGLASTGIAAVARIDRRPRILMAGTIRTATGLPEPSRLRIIADAVRGAIAEHHPAALAVERVMWGSNKTSALSVARATGVVMLAAAEAGIPVEEYPPLDVKMAIAGMGNADKQQMRVALVRTHRLEGVPEQPDAADAVAVALCHLQRSRLLAAAARASARAGAR